MQTTCLQPPEKAEPGVEELGAEAGSSDCSTDGYKARQLEKLPSDVACRLSCTAQP